jgi:hypothetical protein
MGFDFDFQFQLYQFLVSLSRGKCQNFQLDRRSLLSDMVKKAGLEPAFFGDSRMAVGGKYSGSWQEAGNAK